MEQEFFKARLAKRGIETVIPDDADREIIHASIFAELVKRGITTLEYLDIADGELLRIAHITRQTLGFYREFSAPTSGLSQRQR